MEALTVNWDTIQGNWTQFKGSVREKWGDLTDDDLERIGGNREQLIGRIQERYGKTRDQVEREVDMWADTAEQPVGSRYP
jgi:uncharacterized protein YjbJ (UPF0337 family)